MKNPSTLNKQIKKAIKDNIDVSDDFVLTIIGYDEAAKAIEIISLEFAIIQMRKFYYDSAVEDACDKLRKRLSELKSVKT